jgi:hypothetical protein
MTVDDYDYDDNSTRIKKKIEREEMIKGNIGPQPSKIIFRINSLKPLKINKLKLVQY